MPDDVFQPASGLFASDKMVRDWLRKPFPKDQVGRIPASKGRPALDFVGHAAVTDRLNKIEPSWHYTLDDVAWGPDKVWIRGTMTIGGISRPEFGDGADPKEAIGNFIRRGAMRFGVALDLWSRQELEPSPVVETGEGSAIGGTTPATLPDDGKQPEAGESLPVRQQGSSTKPASGFPVAPINCDHIWQNGGSAKVSGTPFGRDGDICGRCGQSWVVAMEGTTQDLGAA